MSFVVRDVNTADMAAISTIYREAVLTGTASFELEPPDTKEMTARMQALVADGFPYLVAEDTASNAVLGYGYAGHYRTRPAYRWTVENSVYIDPAAQGHGIGKAITSELIIRCTEMGFRQMIAVIGGADHVTSIAMHHSLGFERVGLLPSTGFKHGRWLASVLMQRPLGEGDQTKPTTEPGPRPAS